MSVSSHGHTRTHSQPYTQHTRQPSSSTLPPLPQTPGKSPRTAFSHTSHHPPTERDFDSELGLIGDAGDIDYDGQGDITVEEAEGRQEDAVHFCLLAEFDIDAGATLAHQYPYPTGTDEHADITSRLAELMLPDGAHLRAEDWTIFYLGQTPSSAIAPMFSHEDQVPSSTRTSTDNEDLMAAGQNGRSSIGGSVDSGNLGVGSTEEILESASVTITKPKRGVAGGGLLYVLNCVRMKEDKKMRRGAMVKAMAICTPNPYIGIYKPLLLLALEEYFISPSPEILARLYDSANAISIAGMPRLSRSERILLRQSERKDLFEDKFILPDPAYLAGTKEYFEDEDQQAKSDEGSNGGVTDADLISINSHASRPQSHQRHTKQMSVSSRMSARPEIGLRKGSGSSSQYRQTTPSSREGRYTPEAIIGQSRKGIPRDTHFFETEARFKKITVPIRIPMTVFDEDVGDYSIIELVNAFSQQMAPFPPPFHPHLHTNGPLTHPVILIFNALIANKRVMFLGHGLPANQVARMVLAACALVSGCGQVLRGITESAFPYANLASLDILEEFNSGFVAGVTNPRFEELPSTWDVLCNLETGKVTVSKELKSAIGPNPALVNMGMSKGSGRSSESSLDKSIVKVDEDTGTAMSTPAGKQAAQSRADCVDNQFMEDILSAMQSHYGEPHIRLRFTDYLIRFIRLASYQEFIHTGSTKIGYPTIPCKEGHLGSGTVFGDDQSKSREMWGNGYRIEAWRKTKSYKLYVKDWARWQRKRAVSGFDVQHQISRLRLGKNMSDGEAEMIFSSLATLRSYDQIVELLTLLPPHLGGLTPLANGLFHRWPGIRESTVEIVLNLQQFAVGRQAVAAMNYYHRKTFLQLIERRAQQREQEQLRSDRYSQISGSPIIPYSQYSHSFSHSRSQTGSESGYEAVTSPGTVHGSMPSTPQGVRGTQESQSRA